MDMRAVGISIADIDTDRMVAIGRAVGVPMHLVDGRPWVPTQLEDDAGDEP